MSQVLKALMQWHLVHMHVMHTVRHEGAAQLTQSCALAIPGAAQRCLWVGTYGRGHPSHQNAPRDGLLQPTCRFAANHATALLAVKLPAAHMFWQQHYFGVLRMSMVHTVRHERAAQLIRSCSIPLLKSCPKGVFWGLERVERDSPSHQDAPRITLLQISCNLRHCTAGC